MKPFLNEEFLLDTPRAQHLYHEHAEPMPIIDYHCHLSPEQIATDHQFSTITELWLKTDHFKWSAMRWNGVDERYCTGSDTSDWEKFEKWAETMPYCLRNPLYHWSHIELKRIFGIDKLLGPDTAREIYDKCNEMLQKKELSAQGILKKFRVETLCTSDDPIDSLQWHQKAKRDGMAVQMLPTWRPDNAMNIQYGSYPEYIHKLEEVADTDITTFKDMVAALQKRHDYFAENGCVLSDHGIKQFYDTPYTTSQVDTIFEKAMRGQTLSTLEIKQYKNAFLTVSAEMDYDAGWAQQYHYGALLDNNTVMFKRLGTDMGFDSIGEYATAEEMSHFLDKLSNRGKLTRTVLYCVNEGSNEVMASMASNFQDGSEPGKIQFGGGWWFNDQIYGITGQLNALSMLGLLSRFVGMTSDSNYLLCYSHHEYFRRILCNLLGNDIERGLIPDDEQLVGKMVEDICYNNAHRYFRFK